MKRAVIVLSTLGLAACATVPPDIFVRADVNCGETLLMYSNAENKNRELTVKAIDQCAGGDSEVQMVDANGTVVQRFVVRDGTTGMIPVTVPNGHSLNFQCAGNPGGGNCSYTVSSR